MGLSTALIGVLPTYATFGLGSTALLVSLRLPQGLALGGEYGSAATYVAEHVPDKQRGYYELHSDHGHARFFPQHGRDRVDAQHRVANFVSSSGHCAGIGSAAVRVLRLVVGSYRAQKDHAGGLRARGIDLRPIYIGMVHFFNPDVCQERIQLE